MDPMGKLHDHSPKSKNTWIPACFFLVDGTDVMTQIRWLWGNCVIYYQPGEDVFFTLSSLWRSTLSVEQMRSQLPVIHSLGEGSLFPKCFHSLLVIFVNCFSFKGGSVTHTSKVTTWLTWDFQPLERGDEPNLQKNIIFRWTLLNFGGVYLRCSCGSWKLAGSRFQHRSIKYRWVSYSLYG